MTPATPGAPASHPLPAPSQAPSQAPSPYPSDLPLLSCATRFNLIGKSIWDLLAPYLVSNRRPLWPSISLLFSLTCFLVDAKPMTA